MRLDCIGRELGQPVNSPDLCDGAPAGAMDVGTRQAKGG
jgi:hypothetical protein